MRRFTVGVETRLLRAFRSTNKDKNMIVILDKAVHHHGMAGDWKSPLKAIKSVNAVVWRGPGVEATVLQLDVVHEDSSTSQSWKVAGSSPEPRGAPAYKTS